MQLEGSNRTACLQFVRPNDPWRCMKILAQCFFFASNMHIFRDIFWISQLSVQIKTADRHAIRDKKRGVHLIGYTYLYYQEKRKRKINETIPSRRCVCILIYIITNTLMIHGQSHELHAIKEIIYQSSTVFFNQIQY